MSRLMKLMPIITPTIPDMRIFHDTFNRPDSSSIGSPDLGGAYNLSSAYIISNNMLTTSSAAGMMNFTVGRDAYKTTIKYIAGRPPFLIGHWYTNDSTITETFISVNTTTNKISFTTTRYPGGFVLLPEKTFTYIEGGEYVIVTTIIGNTISQSVNGVSCGSSSNLTNPSTKIGIRLVNNSTPYGKIDEIKVEKV